ncbi:hypothetical protein ASD13_12090 [Microbacterium sp. Root1433D1]|nr:hypothetical protein ASD13_12090 [Microbacterium sp. Root1433D1]
MAIRRSGYANATLGEITDAAGVTAGALYFHFRSKEDVARALVDEQHRIVREAAAEILSVERPAITQMMLLCEDLARRLTDEEIVRAGVRLTTDSSIFSRPVTDPYLDWLELFTELARAADANKETNGEIPPEVLSRFIIPSFTGIQLVSETLTGRADLRGRVGEMWHVLVKAVSHTDRRVEFIDEADRIFGDTG